MIISGKIKWVALAGAGAAVLSQTKYIKPEKKTKFFTIGLVVAVAALATATLIEDYGY